MNNTYVITLGRNIGDKPMSARRWHSFKVDVYNLLCDNWCVVVQRPQLSCASSHDQVGEWGGQVEYACTFVAFAPTGLHIAMGNWLTQLCQKYEQEAIGFIHVAGTDWVVTRD